MSSRARSARGTASKQFIDGLAKRLTKRFGKGVGAATLRRARGFSLTYRRGSALPAELGGEIRSTALIKSAGPEIQPAAQGDQAGAAGPLFPPLLGWSHYLALLRVQNEQARAFYEIEAAREGWSVRELERQIAALLFERLAMNRDPEQLRALARQGQQVATPGDVIKDPFVLEFLDLSSKPTAQERDIEQAIIDRMEDWRWARGSASSPDRSG